MSLLQLQNNSTQTKNPSTSTLPALHPPLLEESALQYKFELKPQIANYTFSHILLISLFVFSLVMSSLRSALAGGLLLASLPVASSHVLFPPSSSASSSSAALSSVLPAGSLTHFCIISSWDAYNQTVATWANMLGLQPPAPGIAGGPTSNSTYLGKLLQGITLISFLPMNNNTRVEFLAGEPSQPSWWRDVYLARGFEVHHVGFELPAGTAVWPVVEAFQAAGLGQPVQWGRWGINQDLGAMRTWTRKQPWV